MTQSADVIVVGAGFAGLKAAQELANAGLSVIVLEAKDRVGGRTKSAEIAGRARDFGGQWVGAGHTVLFAEAARFGISPYKQYETGKTVMQLLGKVVQFTGNVPKMPILSLLELYRVQKRWDREMKNGSRGRAMDRATRGRMGRPDGRKLDRAARAHEGRARIHPPRTARRLVRGSLAGVLSVVSRCAPKRHGARLSDGRERGSARFQIPGRHASGGATHGRRTGRTRDYRWRPCERSCRTKAACRSKPTRAISRRAA